MTTSTSFSFRELPRAASGERWRIAGWVLAAWTLVGLFRAVDRYFSDPFQLRSGIAQFGLLLLIGCSKARLKLLDLAACQL